MLLRAWVLCCCWLQLARAQRDGGGGGGGGLRRVYAWKQLTYNIDGRAVLTDRFGGDEEPETAGVRTARGAGGGSGRTPDAIFFPQNDTDSAGFGGGVPDSRKFFIQYNNVPMGVERWRNKLFVTVPRRRYGIPSTLNYLDMSADMGPSPALRPYPSMRRAKELVSVYRTRVDGCNRLWMVDTGMLEIPNERQQLRPPSIVVYDLETDRQLLRYQLKSTDLVSERTPAGLASITVDMEEGRCESAYAYVTDLATYGLVVYSLQDNDSWRVSHNFFSFSPVAGDLTIAGHSFTWNDGIFSITLAERGADGFRQAYFHPLVSFQEFSVSTRVLRDRALATRDFHGEDFQLVGSRGNGTQSSMHGYHAASGAVLHADVGRDALSCWSSRRPRPLAPAGVAVLRQDHDALIYPSDLHISGDELWLMSNTMPRFLYATLNTEEYNFRIYKGNVRDLISGTVCEPPRGTGPAGRPPPPGYGQHGQRGQ